MKGKVPLFSTQKDDWVSPTAVVAPVREFFGGVIGLDPCTSPDNPCAAQRFFTPADDGLALDWNARSVYVNPPYSNNGKWCERAVVQHLECSGPGEAGRNEIIILVPARTDTRWWHRLVESADAVCFWRGRLRFVAPGSTEQTASSAPFPSALVYLGIRPVAFCKHFHLYGWTVPCQSANH